MEANGIVLSPDPRLRQECAVIEEITPAIEALAEKMKKMMFDNGGCGLAAPQIGELIQLVTIDCDYSDKNDYDPYVLINPVIVEQSDHLVPFSEGWARSRWPLGAAARSLRRIGREPEAACLPPRGARLRLSAIKRPP